MVWGLQATAVMVVPHAPKPHLLQENLEREFGVERHAVLPPLPHPETLLAVVALAITAIIAATITAAATAATTTVVATSGPAATAAGTRNLPGKMSEAGPAVEHHNISQEQAGGKRYAAAGFTAARSLQSKYLLQNRSM